MTKYVYGVVNLLTGCGSLTLSLSTRPSIDIKPVNQNNNNSEFLGQTYEYKPALINHHLTPGESFTCNSDEYLSFTVCFYQEVHPLDIFFRAGLFLPEQVKWPVQKCL